MGRIFHRENVLSRFQLRDGIQIVHCVNRALTWIQRQQGLHEQMLAIRCRLGGEVAVDDRVADQTQVDRLNRPAVIEVARS